MPTIRERVAHAKEQEYLTVSEVALLTRYDPQTVYRKAKKGEIPGLVRFGRGIRFRCRVILQWRESSFTARDLRSSD